MVKLSASSIFRHKSASEGWVCSWSSPWVRCCFAGAGLARGAGQTGLSPT